jgi:hypothetical protein
VLQEVINAVVMTRNELIEITDKIIGELVYPKYDL